MSQSRPSPNPSIPLSANFQPKSLFLIAFPLIFFVYRSIPKGNARHTAAVKSFNGNRITEIKLETTLCTPFREHFIKNDILSPVPDRSAIETLNLSPFSFLNSRGTVLIPIHCALLLPIVSFSFDLLFCGLLVCHRFALIRDITSGNEAMISLLQLVALEKKAFYYFWKHMYEKYI